MALLIKMWRYLLKQWLQKPKEQQKKAQMALESPFSCYKELFLKVLDSLPGIVRPNVGKEPSEGKQAHYKLVELSMDGHLEWKMDRVTLFRETSEIIYVYICYIYILLIITYFVIVYK